LQDLLQCLDPCVLVGGVGRGGQDRKGAPAVELITDHLRHGAADEFAGGLVDKHIGAVGVGVVADDGRTVVAGLVECRTDRVGIVGGDDDDVTAGLAGGVDVFHLGVGGGLGTTPLGGLAGEFVHGVLATVVDQIEERVVELFGEEVGRKVLGDLRIGIGGAGRCSGVLLGGVVDGGATAGGGHQGHGRGRDENHMAWTWVDHGVSPLCDRGRGAGTGTPRARSRVARLGVTTEAMRTRPVTICRTSLLIPKSCEALPSVPSSITRRMTPRAPPTPPKMDTPPSRTAAAPWSSRPKAVSALEVPYCRVQKTPAPEATVPLRVNSQNLAQVTEIPVKRAASSLLPRSYRERPIAVACSNTANTTDSPRIATAIQGRPSTPRKGARAPLTQLCG